MYKPQITFRVCRNTSIFYIYNFFPPINMLGEDHFFCRTFRVTLHVSTQIITLHHRAFRVHVCRNDGSIYNIGKNILYIFSPLTTFSGCSWMDGVTSVQPYRTFMVKRTPVLSINGRWGKVDIHGCFSTTRALQRKTTKKHINLLVTRIVHASVCVWTFVQKLTF